MRRADKGFPTLSWCLSIRNSDPELLEGCLKSLRDRTPQAEIVIVDNVSRQEDTLAVAKRYADVFFTYRGPENKWTPDDPWTYDMASSRQKAFDLASGRWRGWVDDDDRIPGPEEAEKLLRLNGKWMPDGAKVEKGTGAPMGLEDFLLQVEKDYPKADCIWANYLYAKDEHGQAYQWQERERIIKWSTRPLWRWAEKAHEILVPIDGYTPSVKIDCAGLLFIHERKFTGDSEIFAVKRHFDVLHRQYQEGDRTTRRSIYLAGYAQKLCPEREREFIESAHLSSTTPHDRYRSCIAMAQMYVRQGLYWDALENYAAATHLMPGLPDAWFQGGHVWMLTEDYVRAIDWLEKGMATKPGQIHSDITPRHHLTRFPVLAAECYEKAAKLQIKLGYHDQAKNSLQKAVEYVGRVQADPTIGSDKKEADVRLMKVRNAFFAQSSAISIKALADYLVYNDEPKKALELLRQVPWNIEDHPLILELEKKLEPVARHLSSEKAYADFYVKDLETGYVNSPEAWLEPKESLDRARWVAQWINQNCPNATVLDVGCFDGIVGIPLMKMCPGIKYTGIDIYEKSIVKYKERLAKRNLTAEILLVKSIDDLPEDRKFDVILWYEVIEHVPSPVEELKRIKRHSRTGGQIFLTTPWGSFDAGHPPPMTDHGTPRDSRNHVRAMNPRNVADVTDAADLQIEEIYHSTVAEDSLGDGLHVQVTNRPQAPLTSVTFAVPGALWPWNARTVHARGMGASEKSIVQVSEGLAADYRRVEVYGPVPEETACRGVRYWPIEQLRHVKEGKIVVSRGPHFWDYVDRTVKNPLPKILWLQDAYYPDLSAEVAEKYEKIVVVSEWHKLAMHERHGVPLDKMAVIYNPVDVRLYSRPEKPTRKMDHFVYASSPDRGLIPLLRMWPKILERLPEATLDICYGWKGCEKLGMGTDSSWTKRYEGARREFEKLRYQKGVVVKDMVDPVTLSNIFLSAGVWAYPVTDFHETCCTNALEARAAGCVPVAPPLAALSETARCPQSWMTPLPDEQGWEEVFIEFCVQASRVLDSDRKDMAAQAMKEHSIEVSLEKWKAVLDS